MRPYREPGQIDVAPPRSEAELGSPRSHHSPPSLPRVLAGPILISAFVLVFSGPATWPAWVLSSLTLLVLSWRALRRSRTSITLHSNGLVLVTRKERTVVFFDEVDEVWFEIPALHSEQGASLRAMVLVEFGGKKHRVPLTLRGGAELASAIHAACAEPLFQDARAALLAGRTLTFGGVSLDRDGVSIRGDRATWSEIRFVRFQPHRMAFFRRAWLLPWRAVRLDRIPNPSVFCGLVMRFAREVRRDGELMIAVDPGSITETHRGNESRFGLTLHRAGALFDLSVGGLLLSVGLVVAWWTRPALRVLVALVVVYGVRRLLRGVTALLR